MLHLFCPLPINSSKIVTGLFLAGYNNRIYLIQRFVLELVFSVKTGSLGSSLCFYALNLGEDNSIVLG